MQHFRHSYRYFIVSFAWINLYSLIEIIRVITLSEVCQVVMADRKPCGRKKYKNNENCIFHLENKSDEEAEIFKIVFWEELKRIEKDKNIKEMDFTGFIFPAGISFKKHFFEKPVIFILAQFSKNAFFSGSIFKNEAVFYKTEFRGEADFSGAEFQDEADFSMAHFFEEANFYDTEFYVGAHFSEAEFKGYADFSEANFNMADFSEVDFIKEVDFFETQFNSTYFSKAKFSDSTYFSKAKFTNEADFSEAEFGKGAYFSQAQFHGMTNFRMCSFIGEVRFILTKFNNESFINFEYSKFYQPQDVRFQNVDLSNVSFLYADISHIEFLNERWRMNKGRLIVVDESRIMEDQTTYDSVAQLYRRLRMNYETNYRFAEAGEFFIGEMEMRRLDVNADINNERIRNVVLWFKKNFSLLGLYKYLSLYGESYVLPLIWTSIVIISYPMLMHLFFNASLPQLDDFLYTYLRTSASSFFQMDNTYIGERIIGFPLLGLLFIALKRQFERKK